MDNQPTTDRIQGAVLGALVGDALGVGPHWYYDLDRLRQDYGEWIDDYTAPKPGRYHEGLRAGQVSQTGQVTAMLLDSVAETGEYDQEDFTRRLDELLSTLDGNAKSGRYTDKAVRDVWRARVKEGKPWTSAGGLADTGEAAIRSTVLAARFSAHPARALETMASNVLLTHADPFIAGQSTAFGLLVTGLIRGAPMDTFMPSVAPQIRKAGRSLAVPAVCRGGWDREAAEEEAEFFDALLQPGWAVEAARDQSISIEPAHAACRLFGLACTLGFLLPAAYYLAARFDNDFEMAVLSALNGGGNNMARAALTGAVSGAMNGLSGIPQRFIEGLEDSQKVLDQSAKLARDVFGAPPEVKTPAP
ncbi:MAG: ADP-ribosylglycohydrolase family protein [Desulfovibrionaceae bacterium]